MIKAYNIYNIYHFILFYYLKGNLAVASVSGVVESSHQSDEESFAFIQLHSCGSITECVSSRMARIKTMQSTMYWMCWVLLQSHVYSIFSYNGLNRKKRISKKAHIFNMIEWNTDNGVNTLCEENIILSLKELNLSIEKVHSLSFVTNFK